MLPHRGFSRDNHASPAALPGACGTSGWGAWRRSLRGNRALGAIPSAVLPHRGFSRDNHASPAALPGACGTSGWGAWRRSLRGNRAFGAIPSAVLPHRGFSRDNQAPLPRLDGWHANEPRTSPGWSRKAQAGDPASREALARAWLRPAYGVALALTGRAADAEDATQEAFCRAFASLPTLRNPGSLRSLAGADRAGTSCATAGAVPRRRACWATPTTRSPTGTEPARDGDAVQAWRHLPEDERLVCWLKIVDGMTVRALADLLGTSKSAVDRTFRRGLARLRGEMSRC